MKLYLTVSMKSIILLAIAGFDAGSVSLFVGGTIIRNPV
jgi:hypothetical protein